MREIKFRAWDKGREPFEEDWDKPRMIYGVEHLYDGSIKYLGAFGSFGGILDDEQFIVMQFTGLRDKNGVDIYLGDIVEFFITGGKHTAHKNVGEVLWNEWQLAFRISSPNEPWGYSMGGEPHDIVVIGNIHANPELMEAHHG